MEHEEHDRIADLVTAADIALLTTRGTDGRLHSRPLAVLQDEFDGRIWFLVQEPSEKTLEISADPGVNVSFASKKGYLSLAGDARVTRDEAKVDELWGPAAEAWFEGGREDPAIAVLEVIPVSAEYWAKTEPGVFSLIKATKAMITGEQPDIGENRTVGL
ncbi:MAG: pyridoxamine 5'-phosphate oxidase family protein [Actinomycetota bacterium]|nr:pyridoxamine 5'-phosphate oxidase family protein [Actinomycetota bacterium]